MPENVNTEPVKPDVPEKKPKKRKHGQRFSKAKRARLVARAVAMHGKGLNNNVIAAKLGVHHTTVSDWLIKHGSWAPGHHRHTGKNEEKFQQVRAIVLDPKIPKKDKYASVIAPKIGVSRGSVDNWKKEIEAEIKAKPPVAGQKRGRGRPPRSSYAKPLLPQPAAPVKPENGKVAIKFDPEHGLVEVAYKGEAYTLLKPDAVSLVEFARGLKRSS